MNRMKWNLTAFSIMYLIATCMGFATYQLLVLWPCGSPDSADTAWGRRAHPVFRPAPCRVRGTAGGFGG